MSLINKIKCKDLIPSVIPQFRLDSRLTVVLGYLGTAAHSITKITAAVIRHTASNDAIQTEIFSLVWSVLMIR